MVGLVILMIVVLIFLARINPWLTGILISGCIGYAVSWIFVKYGAPSWVIPAGILLWVVMASPEITSLLMTIIPPRRK